MKLPGEKHFYRTMILEKHLDTFGHVNNARYFELLEEARWARVTEGGYGLETVQKLRKGPVVLAAEIEFKRELKLREEIEITTQAIEQNGKIGKIEQYILNPADGSVHARAVFTFGFFDLEKRKLMEATPEWLRAIGVQGN